MMREEQLTRFDAAAPGLAGDWRRACADFREGLAAFRLWGMLGWQDIRRRYQRSLLGPFWLTLNTAIMVGVIGILFKGLFYHQPLDQYLPFVGVKLVIWKMLAAMINDSCEAFTRASGILQQMRMPLTVLACRVVWRNLIIFAHNALIIVVIVAFYGSGWHGGLWALPAALALIAVNGLWVAIVLGTLCARFRDVVQAVPSIVQIAFYLTPVLWPAQQLYADHGWLLLYNPFHHFIELVFAPLFGGPFPALSWLVAAGITAAGLGAALAVMALWRRRVPYWV